MSKIEPIPLEILEAARLKMKREIAAMLIKCLAESGMTYEQVEIRIGEKKGYFKGYINRLLIGKEHGLDAMSDMAVGLGFEWKFSAQRLADLFPPKADTP